MFPCYGSVLWLMWRVYAGHFDTSFRIQDLIIMNRFTVIRHIQLGRLPHALFNYYSYAAGSQRQVLLLSHKSPLSLTATGELGGHGR